MIQKRTTLSLCLFLSLSLGCDQKKKQASAEESPGASAGAKKAEMSPQEKAKAQAKAKKDLEDGYASTFCHGYTKCYKKLGINGNIGGKLIVDIGEGGVAQSVSYQGGDPRPVQDCLVEMMKARKVKDYEGGPGTAVCQYGGSYNSGIEMVSESWGFQRKAGKAAPVEAAPAKEAPVTDEKR